MRCCICASDCKAFTTNLRKHEGAEDEWEIEETDFHCSAGDSGDSGICRHRRRNSTAPVELAAAAALRLAPDHLLASAWTSGAVPDPFRRIWMAPFRSPQFPPSHERPLRAHDAGRAATIPAAHARTLGLRAIDQREQGAMKLKCQVPRI